MNYFRELVYRFVKHCKVFSVNYAILELACVLEKKIKNKTSISKILLEKKEKYILSWAIKYFKDEITKYQNCKIGGLRQNNEKNVWICWLQGYDNAPSLVKKLISNTLKKANEFDVHLLDDRNWTQYCTIPDYIVKKYRQKTMPPQQFADILRASLLMQNGGLWIDATVLITKKIPDDIFEYDIYNIKNINHNFRGEFFVTDSTLWQGYFIEAKKNSVTYSFICDCLYKYWSEYDTLIDYFLISYLMKIARENIEAAKDEYDNIPANNNMCEILDNYLRLGTAFRVSDFKKFVTEDTWIYKLSWKHEYPLHSADGNTTLAKYIFDSLFYKG